MYILVNRIFVSKQNKGKPNTQTRARTHSHSKKKLNYFLEKKQS